MTLPEEDSLKIRSLNVEEMAARRKQMVIETIRSMSIEDIRLLVTEIENKLNGIDTSDI